MLSCLSCLSKSDTINPPELGEVLAAAFDKSYASGGGRSSILWHDAGHELPPEAELINDVAGFIIAMTGEDNGVVKENENEKDNDR